MFCTPTASLPIAAVWGHVKLGLETHLVDDSGKLGCRMMRQRTPLASGRVSRASTRHARSRALPRCAMTRRPLPKQPPNLNPPCRQRLHPSRLLSKPVLLPLRRPHLRQGRAVALLLLLPPIATKTSSSAIWWMHRTMPFASTTVQSKNRRLHRNGTRLPGWRWSQQARRWPACSWCCPASDDGNHHFAALCHENCHPPVGTLELPGVRQHQHECQTSCAEPCYSSARAWGKIADACTAVSSARPIHRSRQRWLFVRHTPVMSGQFC